MKIFIHEYLWSLGEFLYPGYEVLMQALKIIKDEQMDSLISGDLFTDFFIHEY